jgi:tRNA(fMet)-specific endonuclease VapC
MPRYMLDTNMCIYLMKNQPEQVARRFAECLVGDVVMSAITYAELEYGAAVSADPAREHLDKQIAAHAVSLGVTLVTNNVSDFSKYPGLRSENWLTAESRR